VNRHVDAPNRHSPSTTALGVWLGAVAAVALVGATAVAGDGQADAFIIDNAAPSGDLGPSFDATLDRMSRFPGGVSGVLLPGDWADRLLDDPSLAARLGRTFAFGRDGAADAAAFYDWLGLTRMRSDADAAGEAVGAYTVDTEWGPGLTFGCAACHSHNFFGTLVFGMGNKAARANLVFIRAKDYLQHAPMALLQPADSDEAALLRRTQTRLQSVGVRRPQALGLDTSLAQVSLSLARRKLDPTATLSAVYAARPRPDPFDEAIADSKPMDWWAIRYKDRWLSDGALTHGSFVLINFLVNEIGRGTDLVALGDWLAVNQDVVDDFTRFVLASEAPRIEDFLPDAVDAAAARRGERHFLANCAGCHGVYRKDWSTGHRTIAVDYPRPTPVRDVGTDPNRARGMDYLATRLNRLAISRQYGVVLEPTDGYVPPPLVGVWSRYPYLHNRSVPNLCELLKPEAERVDSYYVGTTVTIATDFDRACVGYPTVDVPHAWKTRERLYRTGWTGLSNDGHNMFIDAAESDKRDLIEFLKTL